MDPKLSSLLDVQKTPHSLLLTAPDLDYLTDQAMQFAKEWLQIEALPHPDLILLQPVGKTAQFNIETLRSFKEEVFKPPYLAPRKLFLLLQAERMPPVSANALLKAFEEPLDTSYIFLLSTAPEALLPTVRSRCQELKLSGNAAPIEIAQELYGLLTAPTPFQALECAEQIAARIEKQAENALASVETEKDLTAVEKEAIEKQREGVYAIKVSAQLNSLLLAHLYWVRDLHLMRLGGDPAHLFHPVHHEVLKALSQKGAIPDLERVEQAVQTAKLSLERSSPLSTLIFDYFVDVGLCATLS